MKLKIFQKTIFVLVLAVLWVSCQSKNETDDPSHEEINYFLKKIEDKIFIQFASPGRFNQSDSIIWEQWAMDWEQWNILINSDATLQPIDNASSGWGAFLESKDGKPIPLETIEYFKSSPVVATVSYLLEAEGIFHGLRNDIEVKLKDETSYEQFQQLVEQNYCTIIKEDSPIPNCFFVSVSKVSELDAIQVSKLFYETGLFESVQPTFVVLYPCGNICEYKSIIEVLKDEPGYIRKGCINGGIDAFFFEFANERNSYPMYGVYLFGNNLPEQFREGGLSVYISGNIISCPVGSCYSSPNVRLAPTPLFELKSIKIKN